MRQITSSAFTAPAQRTNPRQAGCLNKAVPSRVQHAHRLTWHPSFRKTTGPAFKRETTRLFTMLRYIASLMLIGGFAASQHANAEPVEIDDLKDNIAKLAAKLPPGSKKQVSYKMDIEPLFKKSCVNCHGPDKRPKGKFRIDTRALALKGGSEGVAIIPGKSDKSPLTYYITYQVVDYEMPPADKQEKYPKLTKEQVSLVRAWIDQGAKYDN